MKRLFLILSVLASAGVAHAEPVPAPTVSTSSTFALVQHLMAQQQWQAAQVALQDAAQDPAADPIEILFLGGMIAIAWLLWRAARGHFSGSYYTPMHLGGLYWHLVDLIWIYLFPLLYLIH